MICPDHTDPRNPVTGAPVADRWWDRDGFCVCSFCGSLEPDDFLKLVLAGNPLSVTNKEHKVYVHAPNPIAGQQVLKSTFGGPTMSYGQLTRDDLTAEELAAGRFERKTYGPASETAQAKFYFWHMNADQQLRFIAAMNEGKIVYGGDFGFRHLPSFVGIVGRSPVTHEYPKPAMFCLRGHENE
jgi:hypothetical protein